MPSLGDLVDTIMKQLPLPETLFEGTWAVIGWMAGKSFSAQLNGDFLKWIDENINNKSKKWIMKAVTKVLNFVHHFWIGLLGVVYFGVVPIAQSVGLPIYIPTYPCAELFWLCLGMATEDAQFHLRASMSDGVLSKVGSGFKANKK